MECTKHRTISVLSQIGKIILKVLHDRLKKKMDETVDYFQFGFRKGMSTRNVSFVLIMVMGRAFEKQKNLLTYFVAFDMAFDRVRLDLMFQRLIELGVDMANLSVEGFV